MSLALQGRGVFGCALGGLGSLGRRTMGHSGSQGRLSATFPLPSSSVAYTNSPSKLLPLLRPGVSSLCLSRRLVVERCHRTGILGTRLLQSTLCNAEGHGRLAPGYRSLSPQLVCSVVPFLNGDFAVGPSISPPRRLDDFSRPSGRLPPGSSPPRISEVSSVLHWRADLPVSGSLLWAFIRSTSLHVCHGPGLLYHASLWVLDPPLFGRLARPWILPPGDHTGEGLPFVALLGAGGSSEPLQKLCYPCSDSGLLRHDSPVFTFEGFPNSGSGQESFLS